MRTMILNRSNSANAWSPAGFEQFNDFYPATDWVAPSPALDQTNRFLALWAKPDLEVLPTDLCIVLTPGLFAECLPQCFTSARREFKRRGHRVLKTKVRTAYSTATQGARLAKQILTWLPPGSRFVWCAHSKGGLDAVWALESNVELRERCTVVVLMQPPVGPSQVIEQWMNSPLSLHDRTMRRLIKSRWFHGGCSEISTQRDPGLQCLLTSASQRFPVTHAVSWSGRATSWVDSYHGKLNKIRPGHAHDGQFYLVDQLLPHAAVVCLPELDHAQPVLGGRGLDVGRLWYALARTAGA